MKQIDSGRHSVPKPLAQLLREAHAVAVAPVFEAVAKVAPDLRPAHGAVMEQLDQEDGRRLTDLAFGAGISLQAVSQLVDQLEDLGYVERRPDPDDRRAKRIWRTRRAAKASRVAGAAVSDVEAQIRKRLGKTRYTALQESLQVIGTLSAE